MMKEMIETETAGRMLLECEKKLVSKLKENERYKYFLGRMQFIKYTGGKENMAEADCSGSVCLALLLATGCSVRVTAEELLKKFFTKKNPDRSDIMAAFFITPIDRKLGGRLYRAGECAHVAGVCGEGVVLNCVEPYAYLRSLDDMRESYWHMNYTCVVRGLDRDALQKASDSGKMLFDADPAFTRFIEAMKGERGGN